MTTDPAGRTARVLDKIASGWRRLSRTLPRAFYSLYVDENPDYRACVLLAGSGRGGTTWLAEVINYDNSYRFMFEPFYGVKVPACAVFAQHQYLRPGDDDPAFLDPAGAVFSGRLRNGWVDAYNRKLRANRRLVKDIRVNYLLGWVRAHFPEMPIILLLRHPCAVAYSRCQTSWHEDLAASAFGQPSLVTDFLTPFQTMLGRLESAFERHVFGWCLETYVPLMQLHTDDILITTYEDCIVSPGREFARIFNYLRRPFDGDVMRRAIGKPSSQARRNWRSGNASPIITGDGMIDAWKPLVGADLTRRAMGILQRFGLHEIYGDDSLPNTQAIAAFMRRNHARPSAQGT